VESYYVYKKNPSLKNHCTRAGIRVALNIRFAAFGSMAAVIQIFALHPGPVFFNLFAAVEPYVSVTVTHGTPCNDKRVQRCRQSRIFRVSRD